jgi:hypothetical protein
MPDPLNSCHITAGVGRGGQAVHEKYVNVWDWFLKRLIHSSVKMKGNVAYPPPIPVFIGY